MFGAERKSGDAHTALRGNSGLTRRLTGHDEAELATKSAAERVMLPGSVGEHIERIDNFIGEQPMRNPSTIAAKVIVTRAERVLAGLRPDDREFIEKRRQAAALVAISAQIDAIHAPRAADLGGAVPTDADRETSATAVDSLATGSQSTPETIDLRGKSAAGWVDVGGDFGTLAPPGLLRAHPADVLSRAALTRALTLADTAPHGPVFRARRRGDGWPS